MRSIDIVVDLGFGDGGKGTTVDFLAHAARAPTIVRFNGGPQAAHNVVQPDGRHHLFAQFGSGMFMPSARTLLSRFVLIEPYAMLREAAHLVEIGVSDPLLRTLIDGRCVIITPAHQAANRLRERARGKNAHGTCGMGVGEAVEDALRFPRCTLRAADLANPALIRERLLVILDHKQRQLEYDAGRLPPSADHDVLYSPDWIDAAVDNYTYFSSCTGIASTEAFHGALQTSNELIFEGAQGILLDESAGFHPYTTWSTTTPANALTLLREAGISDPPRVHGVLRCYATRHGAGPFVTESDAFAGDLPELHNADDGWPGEFRRGAIDFVALRYAIAVAGKIDDLIVTHVDRLDYIPPQPCVGYAWTAPSRARERLFQMSSALTATAIRPGTTLPQGPSEELTQHLSTCRPVFGSALPTNDRNAFAHCLERELARPIRLLSVGPTRSDKIDRQTQMRDAVQTD